ncbi:hypothetical protein ONS95_001901 [Cadophora gregata]|uniref:uncharacterized protein n=1 Tax=Cadophora gregata TaxID=51156 RepID=UPI0026DA97E2|nr:uncharacterized protein ONS95_001901 [Cadophora gregata]KAK0111548.1 hypothetical protein ONS95_001901 [Cadophora gregata]KAK0111976.1 hypothetical protein ONS96_001238 [Cadophora gregata f. sp. sojae]
MKTPITVVRLSLFIQLATSQSLPYNPTTILLPPTTSNNRDLAYAFLSPDSDTTQFVSLNISSIISPSNLTLDIISSDLPFRGNKSNAFIPSISTLGEISVYTGSCATSTSAALWRFTPSNTSTIGNGTWEEETTTTGSGVMAASLPGADFLSTAFSFSTLVQANASQTKIYVFGGMCPTEVATASTWQSAASYSNHMLRLAPSTSSSPTTYTLEVPTSRGPPIAEAGFSITGLTPTYSNGSGIETQQQSFVLVGGHTQTAFINMSQVAIWSLPEESWSFVTVDSPGTSNANTELAVKNTVTKVDSRSGHTAVLTEDGGSIIILGGWVGDVSQAADPQLAVLNLGQGFGGTGDWQWTVPDEQPSGNGMYGHGAVMLPGNVMMVLGGYNISSSGNSKRDTATGVQPQFFNATSMTWTSDYTNPAYVAAIASNSASASSASKAKSTSTRVGLGAGLGLGLAAVVGALLFYFCYNRRVHRMRKEAREKDLRNLSLGASNFYESPTREMSQSAFPWSYGRWNGRNEDGERVDPIYDSNSAVAGYENLNSGIHGLGDRGQIPQPPKQIPRKPLHSRNARGAYQPTPTFDFSSGNAHGRTNSLGTAGPIHPIYEADEDDQNHHPVDGVGMAIGDPNFVPGPAESSRYSDPFKDPPAANFAAPIRRNRSVSSSEAESPAQSREREIQEWVSDWAAADALLNSQARSHSNIGRISPTRRAQLIAATTVSSVSAEEDSSRTASNLSERTDRSVNISTVSVSRSGSSSQGRSRSNSLRGFITGMNPFASTVTGSSNLSPIFDTHTGVPLPRSAGSGSSSSFNTANTSFPALQAEGETLLPRPVDEFSAGDYSPARSHPDFSQGSPSKSKPFVLGKGRAGWLGSLRRVFISNTEGEASEPFNPHAPIYRDVSPTRDQPRRTVSAGATLWRRKQGKGDWEDSADLSATHTRSNTFTSDLTQFARHYTDTPHSAGTDDEDWDVEQAVQNRVVQVMFTVPKEKLRVVNADEDEMRSEAASSVAGGSLRSRKGSGRKSLRGLIMPMSTPGGEEGHAESQGKPLLVDLDIDDAVNVDGRGRGDLNRTDGGGKGKGKETIFDHDVEVKKERDREKMSERERVREMEKEMEWEMARGGSPSPNRKEKGKSKVLDLVESIERRGSPER